MHTSVDVRRQIARLDLGVTASQFASLERSGDRVRRVEHHLRTKTAHNSL